MISRYSGVFALENIALSGYNRGMSDIENDKELTEPTTGTPSVSNTPLMWMHLTWLPPGFVPIIPLIIWGSICVRKPQAWTHLKNILNASFTFILFHTLSLFSFLWIAVALVSYGFIEGTVWWHPFGFHVHSPNPIPGMVYLAIYMSVLACVVISIIKVSIAAKKGKVLPYWWAIRFFRIVPR